VSFFVIACEANVGRLHYRGTLSIKCCAYPTASEQLGIFASFPRSWSVVVSATFSTCIFVFLRHKATTTNNMVIFGEQAEYEQAGCIYPIVQTFQRSIFKVVVKEGGMPYFFNADRSTKFPFSWTGNPWRYKDMKPDELSMADKEVVEVLMKFTNRLPTNGLVRIYNSFHPIFDIEGIFLQFQMF